MLVMRIAKNNLLPTFQVMKMPPTEPNGIHFSTWDQNDLIKSPNYLVEWPPLRPHQRQKIWRVIHFELGAHWALHLVLGLKIMGKC